jgi:hypothetical protein
MIRIYCISHSKKLSKTKNANKSNYAKISAPLQQKNANKSNYAKISVPLDKFRRLFSFAFLAAARRVQLQ